MDKHKITVTDSINKIGICSICGQTELSRSKPRKGRKATRWECKTRKIQRAKEYRDSLDYDSKARASRLKREYNANEENITYFFSIESCECCGKHKSDCFNQTLYFDHCHDSNLFRGALCNSCNAGLGFFQNSIETLQKAITYLIKNSNTGTEKSPPENVTRAG